MTTERPRKLADSTVKVGISGRVQFSSPRWDWESWTNRVLLTFIPNHHGIEGASLLTAAECRRVASELLRRASDLDEQRVFARTAGKEAG